MPDSFLPQKFPAMKFWWLYISLEHVCRFDLQKSQSRNDHLEVQLVDALEQLQKRPTRSSSSPNERDSSTPSGDKGQEALGGVAEGGASSSGKEDKATNEEVCVQHIQ